MASSDRTPSASRARRGRPRLGHLAALAMLLGGLAAPAACRAGLIFTVENSSPDATGAGTFDVTLSNPDATSYQVAAFSFEIALQPATGVMFTGVDQNTAAPTPYLFLGNSGGFSAYSPTGPPDFPTQDLAVSDLYGTPNPGYQTVAPGQVYGLGHVSYTVPAGTIAPVTVAFVPAGTSVTDPNGNSIPFDPIGGTITPAVVPEPSSLVMLGTAGVVALIARAVRRRRATA